MTPMSNPDRRYARSFCAVKGCDCMKPIEQCKALTLRDAYSEPHRCEKHAEAKGLCVVHARWKAEGRKVAFA